MRLPFDSVHITLTGLVLYGTGVRRGEPCALPHGLGAHARLRLLPGAAAEHQLSSGLLPLPVPENTVR